MRTYPGTDQVIAYLKKEKKGILRTVMNVLITEKKLEGKVLDIGSNHTEYPSYYRYFSCKVMKKNILLDIYEHKKPDIVGDAQNLPFKGATIDTVISFNLLEHVPDPEKAIAETARVLKKNKKAYFFTPYLTALHSEQKGYGGDFCRLSHNTWQIWANRYFKHVMVYPVAYGPMVQALVLFEHFIPAFIRNRLNILSLKFDNWLVNRKPYLKGKYLLGVYVEATK